MCAGSAIILARSSTSRIAEVRIKVLANAKSQGSKAMIACALNMRSITALLILLQLGIASTADAAADQRIYKVYHRLGSGGEFTERGSVVLSAGGGGDSGDGGNDENGTSSSTGGDAPLTATATNSEDCLVPSAVDEMISTGSMYTIRVVDETTGQSATASVPGCGVRRANFR